MKRAMLVLALALSAGCKSKAPAWMNLPPPVEQHGVRVVTEGVKRFSFWFIGLSGEATNLSGEAYKSCTLRFECFDALGAKIGTATASCEDFEPDAVWSFTADLDQDAGDVEIVAAPLVQVRR